MARHLVKVHPLLMNRVRGNVASVQQKGRACGPEAALAERFRAYSMYREPECTSEAVLMYTVAPR